MTDYRDPTRPGARDPDRYAGAQAWSGAAWGWIAGIAVVVLILVFVFGMTGNSDRVTSEKSPPPATTGQGSTPPAPPAKMAPSKTNPAPTPPAKQ